MPLVPATIHLPPPKEWVAPLQRVPARVVRVPVAQDEELLAVTEPPALARPFSSVPVDPVVLALVVLPLQAVDAPVAAVVVADVDQAVAQPEPSVVAVRRASLVSRSARSGKSLKCRRLPPLAV